MSVASAAIYGIVSSSVSSSKHGVGAARTVFTYSYVAKISYALFAATVAIGLLAVYISHREQALLVSES